MYNIDSMFEVPLSESDIEELKTVLEEVRNPVRIITFTAENCRYCSNTIDLIELVVKASPQRNGKPLIMHEIVEYSEDKREIFAKYGIERVPTVVLLDGYIRYVGMPAGEEIRGFIETIIRIGSGDSGLSERTKSILSQISKKMVIDVVVTPTCPYCPYASLLSNMFAYESYRSGKKSIISKTIEAYENPDIADMYNVMTVPTVAINRSVEFVGPPTEDQLLDRILKHAKY